MLVGLGAILFKAAGPVALGGRQLPARLSGLVGALAPALLAALIVTQVFGGDSELVLDARAAGLGAAAVLIAVRAPILAVVIGAAAVTALARAM
ncbi:MAG: branched-chain amino acid ABC transporter [Anaerolinea sp.]|nr:branched-chain amino acid ABC transporter [Anaerolinea sp.]